MFTPKQDALKAEVRRLMDIYDWTQGAIARNASGAPVGLHMEETNPRYAPCSFCMSGFILVAERNLRDLQGMEDAARIRNLLFTKIEGRLNKGKGPRDPIISITAWNDMPERTAAEVRAQFE